MRLLLADDIKNNTYKITQSHLAQLSAYFNGYDKLPNSLIEENINLLVNASEETVYKWARFYKGIRIVARGAANKLALIGLLKSLYLLMQKNSRLNNCTDIKRNIYQLEQIVNKMYNSFFPFFYPTKSIMMAIDLLEGRLGNLEHLKIKNNPLLINMTSINSQVYFAHYLPNCNYINLYSIRSPKLVQDLIYHEIGHLLIYKGSGDTRKLPDDYLKISPSANFVNLAVEEFCDNFCLYIKNIPINPPITAFFDSYLNPSERRNNSD